MIKLGDYPSSTDLAEQSNRLFMTLVWLLLSPAVHGLTVPSELLDGGKAVVLEGWAPKKMVEGLRRDAEALYGSGLYSVPDRDVLLRQGPKADRSVLRESTFSSNAGDKGARELFTTELSKVKKTLAEALDRPTLLTETPHRHEASYTRFGPGASLKKHLDEHHEELKGREGWRGLTRRSISWLCYLNSKWDPETFGGQLRTYERRYPASTAVGAVNGDLQVAWLQATPEDPVDRPVFMTATLHDDSFRGNCCLYVLDDRPRPISRTFFASPIMFLKTDAAVKALLLTSDAQRRYTPLENLQSPAAVQRFERFIFQKSYSPPPLLDGGGGLYDARFVVPRNIPPLAGTLVLFDSVTLPHEVLETRLRPRFAVSGWFHEDQQPHTA